MSQQHELCAPSLRWWRRHRGLSQLELAGRADISQRHLSFLELGRASPSRRHGDAACHRARRAAAPAQCAADRGRLRAGLARRPTSPRPSSARSALRSISCWRSRSRFRPSRSIGTGICCRAIPAPCAWSSSWSGHCAPDTPINLADALVAPTCCGRTLSTGPRWSRYFIRSVEADAAADGTRRPPRCSNGCSPMRACRRRLRAPRPELGDHAGASHAFPQRRDRRCACSRPSPRWAFRRTSRCRNSGSKAFFRWTTPPPACGAAGLETRLV